MRRFAGVTRDDYEFLLERVALNVAGEANRAIDRWKALERQGWDLTVLGALDGSHMVALGCRYRADECCA